MYLICTAQDLQQLRLNPAGAFRIVQDIDLQGMPWEPLGTEEVPFSGVLEGCGHTVSNICITPKDGPVGFFGVVTGTVSDLKLENVTISTDRAAGPVGAIVGENRGDLCAVRLTDGTMTLTAAGGAYVGAVAGANRDGLLRNCMAEVNMTVCADEGRAYVGGIIGLADGGLLETLENAGRMELSGSGICQGLYAGKLRCCYLRALKFSAEMNRVNGALFQNPCGEELEDVTFDGCIWRDNSNSDELLTPESARLRDICERHMHRMGTVAWTPNRRLNYVCSCGGKVHDQTFEKGETYYGVPYTHKHRPFEQFEECFRPDGTLQPWLKEEGWDGFDLHMGCDCSGAIYWSWCRVSPEPQFRWTGNMIPYNDNGTVKVGDYTWKTGEENTRQIKELNGMDRIADACAKMHKGDVFLRVVVSGHVRMCASNPVIYRAPDGTVDFMASYVYTHEQGDGLYPKNRHMHSSWLTNWRYNLKELIADDYIPVTTPALEKGIMEEEKVGYQGEHTVNAGKITSNYRIMRTKVTVTDGEAVVWEKSLYTSHRSWAQKGTDFEPRTTAREVDLNDYKPYWGTCRLEAGKRYTYRVDVTLGTGNTYEAVSFDFSK